MSRTGVGGGTAWDGYIHRPSQKSLGIALSGGGIRSGSYALGALQVLRSKGLLAEANYLSCVSGGGYTTIAHTILASETFKRENADDGLPQGAPESFDCLPPWAPLSPEEQHLRDHSNYLAPGAVGKIWGGINFLYGLVRHLLQFAVYICLAGIVYGLWLYWWLGPYVKARTTTSVSFKLPTIIAVVLGLAIGGLFLRRTSVQTGPMPSGKTLGGLQKSILLLLLVQALVVALAIAIPWLLLYIARHRLGPSAQAHTFSWNEVVRYFVIVEGALSSVSGAAVWLLRRGILQRTLTVVMPLIGPLVVLFPFLWVSYWVMARSTLVHPFWLSPRGVTIVCGALIAIYIFVDEVTPTMHLFYRERLATAFVGYRARTRAQPMKPGPAGNQPVEPAKARDEYGFKETPWSKPILLSDIEDLRNRGAATLPNLVVCAAVNVGADTPPGRLAGSFTFERDFSGGPLTGYVSTSDLEKATGKSALTLPALMAISGAAVSPSMGKMTKSWARMLLAMFNVRLAVWIRNPLRGKALSPAQMGRYRCSHLDPPAEGAPGSLPWRKQGGLWDQLKGRARRPGILYAFWEAVGANDLKKASVYVSDGGHWDNLGLVELLRRGCGQVLCFDASGGGVEHFNTLGEAIALARTELGIWIDIDLDPLRPDPEKQISKSDIAVGTIHFPDTGWKGVLVYAKATISKDAPRDAVAFRDRDKKFPAHSTLDQLFDDQKFESYKALGGHAALTATNALLSRGLKREKRPC